MMATKLVSKAAQWLAQGKDRTAPPEPTTEERLQAIAALELALVQRTRRSPRVAWWQISVAASLLLAVGFGVGYAVLGRWRGPVPVASVLAGSGNIEGAGSSLAWGGTVPAERRIETGSGQSLELAWVGLAHVKAEPETTFALLELGNQHLLRLERGAVSLEVAPLPAMSRLVVETLDVSVEVRGTAFRVAIESASAGCAAESTTRVKVSHGLVAVRRRGEMVAALGAGQSWPACLAPEAQTGRPDEPATLPGEPTRSNAPANARATSSPKKPSPKHGPSLLARPGHRGAEISAPPAIAPSGVVRAATSSSSEERAEAVPSPRAPVQASPALEPAPSRDGELAARTASSDLGQQNDLFAAALTAKAEGKNSKALASLGQLLQGWPRGALAENARAEKMRLLAQMGRKAAALIAARDYLTYHPSGFAHAEATSLLSAPSP